MTEDRDKIVRQETLQLLHFVQTFFASINTTLT